MSSRFAKFSTVDIVSLYPRPDNIHLSGPKTEIHESITAFAKIFVVQLEIEIARTKRVKTSVTATLFTHSVSVSTVIVYMPNTTTKSFVLYAYFPYVLANQACFSWQLCKIYRFLDTVTHLSATQAISTHILTFLGFFVLRCVWPKRTHSYALDCTQPIPRAPTLTSLYPSFLAKNPLRPPSSSFFLYSSYKLPKRLILLFASSSKT